MPVRVGVDRLRELIGIEAVGLADLDVIDDPRCQGNLVGVPACRDVPVGAGLVGPSPGLGRPDLWTADRARADLESELLVPRIAAGVEQRGTGQTLAHGLDLLGPNVGPAGKIAHLIFLDAVGHERVVVIAEDHRVDIEVLRVAVHVVRLPVGVPLAVFVATKDRVVVVRAAVLTGQLKGVGQARRGGDHAGAKADPLVSQRTEVRLHPGHADLGPRRDVPTVVGVDRNQHTLRIGTGQLEVDSGDAITGGEECLIPDRFPQRPRITPPFAVVAPERTAVIRRQLHVERGRAGVRNDDVGGNLGASPEQRLIEVERVVPTRHGELVIGLRIRRQSDPVALAGTGPAVDHGKDVPLVKSQIVSGPAFDLFDPAVSGKGPVGPDGRRLRREDDRGDDQAKPRALPFQPVSPMLVHLHSSNKRERGHFPWSQGIQVNLSSCPRCGPAGLTTLSPPARHISSIAIFTTITRRSRRLPSRPRRPSP